MEERECRALCAVIAMVYPRADFAEETPRVWHRMLLETGYDEAEFAVRDYVAQGNTFPPGVAEILRIVTERRLDLPEWDEALVEIRGMFRKGFSSYRAPKADDWSFPLLAQFMAGRWRDWTSLEQDTTFRAQERNAYNALRERAVQGEARGLVSAPRRSELPGGRREGLRRMGAARNLITEGGQDGTDDR